MDEATPKPKGKRGGHNLFVPTAHQRIIVRALKGIGYVPNESIALAVIDPKTGKGISVPTLLKAFPEELADGKLVKLARVVNSVYRQALKGNMKAAQMLLVALAPEEWGFRIHLRIAASKEGDAPPPSDESAMENLSDQQLEEIVNNYKPPAEGEEKDADE